MFQVPTFRRDRQDTERHSRKEKVSITLSSEDQGPDWLDSLDGRQYDWLIIVDK